MATYDPHAASVVSLLYFDNGLTDEIGHSWSGNVSPSGGELTFNGASAHYISTVPAVADHVITYVDDWTIEFRVKLNASSTSSRVIFCRGYGPGSLGFWVSLNLTGISWVQSKNGTGSSTDSLGASFSFTPDVYYHIAICGQGTFREIFVDGVSIGSKTFITSWNSSAGQELFLGRLDYAAYQYNFYGTLDQFRYTKGVARYTSGFTVGGHIWPDQIEITTFRDTILAIQPTHYWRLGEGSGTIAVDEIGTSNGAYQNFPTLSPELKSEKYGKLQLFTPSDNTRVDTGFALSPAEFTWMFIAEPLDSTDTVVISNSMYYALAHADFPFSILLSTTAGTSTVTVKTSSGDNYVADQILTHSFTEKLVPSIFAITYTSTTISIYIDGQLATSGPSSSLSSSGLNWHLGTYAQEYAGGVGSASRYSGYMGEVSFFNRVLTTQEIIDAYNAMSISYRSTMLDLVPLAYWRLGEALSTDPVVDEMATYPGTYVGSPTTGVASLLALDSNTSVKFNGAQYAQFGDVLELDAIQSYSITAIVKVNDLSSEGAIISKIMSTSPYTGFDILINQGKIRTHLINSWPANAISYETGVVLKVGNTYQIVVTYNGNGLPSGFKIYVDGVDVPGTEIGTSVSTGISTTKPLCVASREGATYFSTHTIDEVSIFDRVISQEEILLLMSVKSGVPPLSFNETVMLYDPIAFYPLDESVSPTVSDVSGNNNHGDLYGGITSSTSSNLPDSNSFSFNGVAGTSILIDHDIQPTSSTIGVWIKASVTVSGYAAIFVQVGAYSLFLVSGVLASYDWGASTTRSTGVNLVDDQWHFIAQTIDGSNNSAKIYLDGALQLSTSVTRNASYLWPTHKASIGSSSDKNIQNFNGLIDNVFLIDGVLTDDDIRGIYASRNRTEEIIYYPIGSLNLIDGLEICTQASYLTRLVLIDLASKSQKFDSIDKVILNSLRDSEYSLKLFGDGTASSPSLIIHNNKLVNTTSLNARPYVGLDKHAGVTAPATVHMRNLNRMGKGHISGSLIEDYFIGVDSISGNIYNLGVPTIGRVLLFDQDKMQLVAQSTGTSYNFNNIDQSLTYMIIAYHVDDPDNINPVVQGNIRLGIA